MFGGVCNEVLGFLEWLRILMVKNVVGLFGGINEECGIVFGSVKKKMDYIEGLYRRII